MFSPGFAELSMFLKSLICSEHKRNRNEDSEDFERSLVLVIRAKSSF